MEKQHPRAQKNILLKVVSLLFGCICWYIGMYEQQNYIEIRVPISFHDIPPHATIKAPESSTITLRGKRIELHNLDAEKCAFHINAASLIIGENSVSLSPDQLFLPDQVSLLNYFPSTILVYMHNKDNQERNHKGDHHEAAVTT